MGKHTALYLRLSPRPDGRSEGVDVQERQGREYSAMAWPGVPVVVYADRLLSAADEDVWRPEYEKLRQAVRDGQVAHIWCVEQSRLQRLEVGWFVLAAELVAAGIDEVHTNRDGIVRVADDIAGIKAVLAAGEVRKLKKRVNDRLADNAGQGLPPGSVPFGLRHTVGDNGSKTYALVPEEADAIRWAADKVLAGWSLSSVAAALRAQGLHGPHEVKWRDRDGEVINDDHGDQITHWGALTAGSVRKMVTNATVAGFRVHQGRIVGRGNWPAILDEATWQACRARLSAPRLVDRADGGTYPVAPVHSGYSGRKYVLTGGLAVCGVCGAPLTGSLKQVGGRKRVMPYLLCHPKAGGRACVGIMLEATEQYVIDELFRQLDKPEFLDGIATDPHAERREEIITALGSLEDQRNELARMWGTPGELTMGEWQAAKGALAAAERELRAELAAKPLPPARVNIEEARAAWPHMDLGEQREFLRLFISRVTVNRAAQQGKKGLDTDRIRITWMPSRRPAARSPGTSPSKPNMDVSR